MKTACLVLTALLVSLAAVHSTATSPTAPQVFVGRYTDSGDGLVLYRDGHWSITPVCAECASVRPPQSFWWGTLGDLPVVGDFDHDGLADPAVYRPKTQTLWILRSSCNYTCYWEVPEYDDGN